MIVSPGRGETEATLLDLLVTRPPGHSLPGPLYHDPSLFGVELELLWHREWVFAGHECELAEPGDFITLSIGAFPILVVRGHDGAIRALHNVCRHRGFTVCEDTHGTVRRRFVCPYHQWSYVGSSRVDLQACKLEYSIVSPK